MTEVGDGRGRNGEAAVAPSPSYPVSSTSWLWRRSNRLIEIRDRYGFEFVMSWLLLEPVAKPASKRRRKHKWR